MIFLGFMAGLEGEREMRGRREGWRRSEASYFLGSLVSFSAKNAQCALAPYFDVLCPEP